MSLTLRESLRMARERNPELRAIQQDTVIARGMLRQASVLPFNPDMAFAAPGTGPTSPRNPAEATLLQELEVAGQRGLRRNAARAGYERSVAEVTDATRAGITQVALSYFSAFTATKRLNVVREGFGLITRLLEAVRTQVREGEISVLEGTLAEIEYGRAEARVLEAERLANTALLELTRQVGLAPTTTIRLQEEPPSALGHLDAESLNTDSLVALALANRPDLAATQASVRESALLTTLAKREGLPNLRVGTVIEQFAGERLRVGPAFAVTLPLWNRNQGTLDARRAQRVQAERVRDAVQLRVRTEVETAVRSYALASREALTLERGVRDPARLNSGLLETAFGAGKIALPTLLLLRNQLLDAELAYWDAWLARQDALARLNAATGRPLLDAANSAAPSTPNSPDSSR